MTAVVVIVVLTVMARRGRVKPDMYALVFDETDNTVSLMRFLKIGDRVFTAIDTSYPMFLILPSNTKVYTCIAGRMKVPCVLAHARSLLALPLDPQITAAVSHLLSSEGLERIENEDAVKILRRLYEMEENKVGRIRVAAPAVLAIAFDVKRIISEIIARVFGAAAEAVTHYFRIARNIETVERYLQALGAYAERRMSWLVYVAIIIMVVAIAAALIMNVFPGVPGRP